MAFTVKQVAAMSGVSVRTLHFYDETGLLKPAYCASNGYRFYEEPQLLLLQQILFYRELGFGLKRIAEIVGRRDFEKIAALESHRQRLQQDLLRVSTLLGTIDKTISHLQGASPMKSGEMFTGFTVGAGRARFDSRTQIGGEPHDCKISARDTGGAVCVFESAGTVCWPVHRHHAQDEWVYVTDGAFEFIVGEKRFRVGAGETVFLPRGVAHTWASVGETPGHVLDTYQPAGAMEEFFREVGTFTTPALHEALGIEGLARLFHIHGMELVGPPPAGEWQVDAAGRITRTA